MLLCQLKQLQNSKITKLNIYKILIEASIHYYENFVFSGTKTLSTQPHADLVKHPLVVAQCSYTHTISTIQTILTRLERTLTSRVQGLKFSKPTGSNPRERRSWYLTMLTLQIPIFCYCSSSSCSFRTFCIRR